MATGTEKTIVRYDPLGRMYEVVYDADTTAGGTNSTRRLYYDGHDLVLEYDANGAMLHRYVHGVSGGDDPLVQWSGSVASIGGAQYLYSDMRGSIVGIYNRSGTAIEINAYDEFGTPDQDNGGRFQFTGQQYVPELGLYYYKARMYSFRQGRFMQTDPIGYADGMNMYAYVGNDPVNGVDPSGLTRTCVTIINYDENGDPTGPPTTSCSNDDSSVFNREDFCYFIGCDFGMLELTPEFSPDEIRREIENVVTQLVDVVREGCDAYVMSGGDLNSATTAVIGAVASQLVNRWIANRMGNMGDGIGRRAGDRSDIVGSTRQARTRGRVFAARGHIAVTALSAAIGYYYNDEINGALALVASEVCGT